MFLSAYVIPIAVITFILICMYFVRYPFNTVDISCAEKLIHEQPHYPHPQ